MSIDFVSCSYRHTSAGCDNISSKLVGTIEFLVVMWSGHKCQEISIIIFHIRQIKAIEYDLARTSLQVNFLKFVERSDFKSLGSIHDCRHCVIHDAVRILTCDGEA